jgi:uncharacterized protein YdcH (DUF465 family)
MIQIHILRSADVDKETLQGVHNYLAQFPGVMQFRIVDAAYRIGRHTDLSKADSEIESDFMQTVVSEQQSLFFQPYNDPQWKNEGDDSTEWTDFFEICEHFRVDKQISANDHVVMLSSKRTANNWLMASDSNRRNNYFIATEEWKLYNFTEVLYPIAYQLATGILKKFMFQNKNDYATARHLRPIGCMLDHCQRRKDFTIKMRTADVCVDCQQLIRERHVPEELCLHVFRIMEGIRSHILFKERFSITRNSPGLTIDNNGRTIRVRELGNIILPFNPLENTLYRFFLNHPEGIRLSFLQDYRDEIMELYQSNKCYGSIEEINSRIDDLLNPSSNSASEKISRIKRKILELVDEYMAQDLLIQGAAGEVKRIALERSKVEYC